MPLLILVIYYIQHKLFTFRKVLEEIRQRITYLQRRKKEKVMQIPLTCHMCIGPRKPIYSSWGSLIIDLSQLSMPFPRCFLCNLSSARLNPQFDTCIIASSMKGSTFPCLIDSSTSLCQNSSWIGSSIKALSWKRVREMFSRIRRLLEVPVW